MGTGSHGRERGAATVEHVGLAFLIAMLVAAGVGALAGAPPGDSARELGGTIARRIACAPRHPVPCGRNPLALAYGFPLGKLVRYLAPPLGSLEQGGLLPVDYRRCRQASCAAPSDRPGLTASGRRVTAFTSVQDLRRAGGRVLVTYWLYRPTLGWGSTTASGGARGAGRRGGAQAEPRARPRAGAAGDPGRAQPPPLPRRRAPALALANPLALPRLSPLLLAGGLRGLAAPLGCLLSLAVLLGLLPRRADEAAPVRRPEDEREGQEAQESRPTTATAICWPTE